MLKRIDVLDGAIYTQGAHVADWNPAGHRPVLFMSGKNSFAPGKAIRGGVPIIFPWFGSRPEGAHGYARTREWDVLKQSENTVLLGLEEPGRFQLRFQASFGDELAMELKVENVSKEVQTVEMALHTYLAIGDIDSVRVSGLDGVEYIDKNDEFRRKPQNGDIEITAATDRVYLNTTGACVVRDAGWKRRIEVSKTGSNTTVVWNPYGPLADMDNWRGMICVETANAADNAIAMQPGATHTMTARIAVSHDS